MALPLAGYVYFDDEFEFKDGGSGKKLVVVLCDCPEVKGYVLTVRATSQPKGPVSPGCHANEKFPTYFVSEADGLFDEDTWIQLDDIYTFSETEIENRWEHPLLSLPVHMTVELLKCAAESPLIDQLDRDAFRHWAQLMGR